jgi:hypothetical protein
MRITVLFLFFLLLSFESWSQDSIFYRIITDKPSKCFLLIGVNPLIANVDLTGLGLASGVRADLQFFNLFILNGSYIRNLLWDVNRNEDKSENGITNLEGSSVLQYGGSILLVPFYKHFQQFVPIMSFNDEYYKGDYRITHTYGNGFECQRTERGAILLRGGRIINSGLVVAELNQRLLIGQGYFGVHDKYFYTGLALSRQSNFKVKYWRKGGERNFDKWCDFEYSYIFADLFYKSIGYMDNLIIDEVFYNPLSSGDLKYMDLGWRLGFQYYTFKNIDMFFEIGQHPGIYGYRCYFRFSIGIPININ